MKNLLVLLFTILTLSVSAQNLETLEIEGRLLAIKAYPLGYNKPTDMGRIELTFLTTQGTEIKINQLGICLLTNYRSSMDLMNLIVEPKSIKDNKIQVDVQYLPLELKKDKSYKLRFKQVCFSQIIGFAGAYAYEKNAIYDPTSCQGFTLREGNQWNYDDDPAPDPNNVITPNYSFFDKDGKIYLLVGFKEL
ncbi:hypothetical protein [Raineya orbicola]|uniref:Uncharacterized protein n=1 Tax=Raineya orbicola TaxID=2016530 RepID=A0A2N3ICF4_9BACT|nr:hypothetical protein [Raineya orbicola]PKQ68001.1 hypothetical protein Rain11_1812 [Raineya orbicola]